MKTIAWLWVLALITVLLALATGCASPAKLTRAELHIQCGSNVVTVVQPKDTIIDRMEFDPVTGKLVLFGYQSTGNSAAIEASKAQAAAQADVWKAGFMTLERLGDKASSTMLPRGYKIVPSDDPSEPNPELE